MAQYKYSQYLNQANHAAYDNLYGRERFARILEYTDAKRAETK